MKLRVLSITLLAVLLSTHAAFGAAPKSIPEPTVKEYNLLLRSIMSFEQRESVDVGTSNEPMVSAKKYDSRILTTQREDMLPYMGELVVVRDSVAKKLAAVNARLYPQGYVLKVVYGYRHPEIQTKYFERRKAQIKKEWDELGKKYTDDALNRATDVFSAYPPIAGHPTGGCVDVRFVRLDDGKELDCTPATQEMTSAEEEDVMKTFSKHISPQQLANRMFMHETMLAEGFAPFYGEWWHFMYGEREWAAFIGEKAAMYAPVAITATDIKK
jgi:D-alanyl-D-alanine dipeptidase